MADWAAAYAIDTARCRLTPCDAAAAPAVHRIAADPAVADALFAADARATSGTPADAWIQHEDDWAARGCFDYAVRRREDDAVIGFVGFVGTDISFAVARDHWARGYGAETVAACLAAAPRLLGLSRATARVLRENRASIRLVERCGFKFKGLARPRDTRSGAVRALLDYRLDMR